MIKKIKPFVKSFKKWFYKVEYDTQEFRKFKGFIIAFYDYHFEPDYHFHSFRLTKVRLYIYPKSITIEIHSLSPGMIIGKSGKNIDALQAYMQKRYSKPVKIDLQETNPFK